MQTGRPDGSWGSYRNGKQDGVWFLFYTLGNIGFSTYSAGTLHGPKGEYNGDGERDGYFGSYINGRQSGTWTMYRNGEKVSTTEY